MNTINLKYFNRQVYREGRNTPRWERYTNVNVGSDGNSYDHQMLTARHIRKYGKYDQEAGIISLEQYTRLRIVGFLHDLPEYIGGDVTGDDKHTIDTSAERDHWNMTIARVLNNHAGNLADIDYVYQVDTDKQHELYTIFKIYEKIGYIYGAILASQLNPSTDENLQWLCNNVIGNNLAHLLEQLNIYPSINHFIGEHSADISTVIGIGASYTNKLPEKNTLFYSASSKWDQYV